MAEEYHLGDMLLAFTKERKINDLPPFSLIRDFGKQNTCGNVSKIFSSVFHVIIPANFFSVKCMRFSVSTESEFPKIYRQCPKIVEDFQ